MWLLQNAQTLIIKNSLIFFDRHLVAHQIQYNSETTNSKFQDFFYLRIQNSAPSTIVWRQSEQDKSKVVISQKFCGILTRGPSHKTSTLSSETKACFVCFTSELLQQSIQRFLDFVLQKFLDGVLFTTYRNSQELEMN